MRVLVTGGAGFFGSHTVRRLLSSGHEVVVLDDMWSGSPENLSGAEVTLIEGSVLDPSAVDAALPDVDAVLHMAVRNVRESLTDPSTNHEVNATGTLVVLERLRVMHRKPWFVYCSSSEVYGNASGGLLSDTDTVCRPATVYGASKYAGELITQAYRETFGIPSCVIRPFNVYGPLAHMSPTGSELVTRFLIQALRGQPFTIFGEGSQRRDLTWVEDAAEGLCAAVDAGPKIAGKTVNLGSGEAPTVLEMAQLVTETLGRGQCPITWIEDRPGDVRSLLPDTTLARDLLGFEARTSVRQGLRRMAEYLRERFTHEGLPALDDRNW